MAFYYRTMQPHLISNGFLPAVANQETHTPGHPNQVIYSAEYKFENPRMNASMLEDVKFQNILVEKTYMNENILLIAFDGLDQALANTIGMIQAELRK